VINSDEGVSFKIKPSRIRNTTKEDTE